MQKLIDWLFDYIHQDKFYAHSFDKEDHYRLSQALLRNADKFNFLLTYDNSQEIWDMYDWATAIFEREWNYTISRTDDQSKNGKKFPANFPVRQPICLFFLPTKELLTEICLAKPAMWKWMQSAGY